MAFTFTNPGVARRLCNEYSKSPFVFGALKSFFLFWSSTKKNAPLRFYPLTPAGLTTATTGQIVDSGSCRIHVVYGRTPSTNNASSYLVLGDNATNVAGASGAREVVLTFSAPNEDAFLIHPEGIPIGTGIVAFAATAAGTGTTLNDADDAPSGFVIVGAA